MVIFGARDFAKGSYQTITLAGSLVIDVIFNWPDPDPSVQTRMRLAITVPNANYTVTFPAEVSQNITAIAGISGNTVSFSEIGTYVFELGTSDEGTSINIVDLNRNYNTFQGNLTVTKLINNTTVTGVSITVANVNGEIVGNIARAGTNKIKATKNGKEVEFAKRTSTSQTLTITVITTYYNA